MSDLALFGHAEDFPRRLHGHRFDRGWSAEWLAAAAGIPFREYQLIEDGERPPTPAEAMALQAVFLGLAGPAGIQDDHRSD